MTEESNNLTFIFDLGGVLIEWDPRHLYRKLFPGDRQEMEYFLSNICSPEWNHQLDLGRPFIEAVEELATRYPQYKHLIRAYHDRWEEMVPYALNDTIALLGEIKQQGYTVIALSNWSHETFPIMRRRFSFLRWFDNIFISGELKVAKPDPAIFAICLNNLNHGPEQCIFIDDSITNIDTAARLGFKTILFHSAQALREELIDYGLVGT